MAAGQETNTGSTAGPPLQGLSALVTGGARGIGRGIALALAKAGADVGVADLHLKPFQGERWYRLRERWSGDDEAIPTAQAIRDLGRQSVEIAVDVGDADSARDAIERCEKTLGRVDILVNNAGIVNNIASIAEMTPEAWEQELRVNLSGGFHCTRIAAPLMAARGFGRVINISSVAARFPAQSQPAYSASKAGVVAFTQSVAQEFGPSGITANAILPGLVATPLVNSMPEKIRTALTAGVPLGRLGTPDDIGQLAAFLASRAASYITGTAIECDGGITHAAIGSISLTTPRS